MTDTTKIPTLAMALHQRKQAELDDVLAARALGRGLPVVILVADMRNLDAIAQALSDDRGEPVEVRSYCPALREIAVGWPHAVWSGACPLGSRR